MRALAFDGAHVKWLDCNVGGRLTMKYPATVLAGKGSRSEIVSIGFANSGQRQDTGGKMLHRADNTGSSIISKIGEEQIFYMRQRGLAEEEAVSMSVNGFINDLLREFPIEYSAALKRLVELEMEGSAG